MRSPHGIPVDLLDRLLMIRLEIYGPAEMIQVWNFGYLSLEFNARCKNHKLFFFIIPLNLSYN